MLTIIIGPSGSGKTTLAKYLNQKYGYKEMVSYTTRAPRPGEINGVDYYFTSNEDFRQMIKEDKFLEYDEYSENRLYGTLVQDYIDAAYSDNNYVVVLTPNGMRKAAKYLEYGSYKTVFITASLANRVIRYIERVKDTFDFSDMNEINARVNRDFGMFLGIENEVDITVVNDSEKGISEAAKLLAE